MTTIKRPKSGAGSKKSISRFHGGSRSSSKKSSTSQTTGPVAFKTSPALDPKVNLQRMQANKSRGLGDKYGRSRSDPNYGLAPKAPSSQFRLGGGAARVRKPTQEERNVFLRQLAGQQRLSKQVRKDAEKYYEDISRQVAKSPKKRTVTKKTKTVTKLDTGFKPVFIGDGFVTPNSQKEATFYKSLQKVVNREERLKGSIANQYRQLGLDINEADKWYSKALKGAGQLGVGTLNMGQFIAMAVDKAIITGRGLFTKPVKSAVIDEMKRAARATPAEIAKSFNPLKPENWANLITVIGGPKIIKTGRRGLAKVSKKYRPSVRNINKATREVSTTLNKVKVAKKLAKQSIKAEKKASVKLINKRILDRVTKLERELTKSLTTLKKLKKDPKVLKLEDYNPIVKSAKLLESVGKEKQLFHATTVSPRKLFGQKYQKLRTQKDILAAVKKTAQRKALRGKLSKAQSRKLIKREQAKAKKLIKEIKDVKSPAKIKRREANEAKLKKLVGGIFKSRKIWQSVKVPKNYLLIRAQPKGMGVSRLKFGETQLFFDFRVATSYAYQALTKNVIPKALRSVMQSAKIRSRFISKLNKLKFIKANAKFTVLEMNTKISRFPRSLQLRVKKASKGQLTAREVAKLRKDLSNYINKNPNKVFIGSRTGSSIKGEREVVTAVRGRLKKVKREFGLDPSTDTLFTVVKVIAKNQKKSAPKSLLTRIKKFPQKRFKQLLKNLKTGDVAKMRRYTKDVKAGKKLGKRDYVAFLQLTRKMLLSKKAGTARAQIKPSKKRKPVRRKKTTQKKKSLGKPVIAPKPTKRKQPKKKVAVKKRRTAPKKRVRVKPRAPITRVRVSRVRKTKPRKTKKRTVKRPTPVRKGGTPRKTTRKPVPRKPPKRPVPQRVPKRPIVPRRPVVPKKPPRPRPTPIRIPKIPPAYKRKPKTKKEEERIIRWVKKQPQVYRASLAAIIFNLTGIPKKKLTGFEIRPIPVKIRRKKAVKKKRKVLKRKTTSIRRKKK